MWEALNAGTAVVLFLGVFVDDGCVSLRALLNVSFYEEVVCCDFVCHYG